LSGRLFCEDLDAIITITIHTVTRAVPARSRQLLNLKLTIVRLNAADGAARGAPTAREIPL